MVSRGVCPNLNHRRTDAPVRFCPRCGEVVNEKVPIKACTDEKHAITRRQGDEYCVDCGERLILDGRR